MVVGKSVLVAVVPPAVLLVLGAAVALPAAKGTRQTSIPTYEIIDLGTLGGLSSVALAVNEAGQVVGSADTPGGLRHAYIWDPATGEMTDLGTLPPYSQSEANDINSAGEVVGIGTTTGNLSEGFLWREGEMMNIGNLGSPDVSAKGVSDATQIVGYARVAPELSHAFVWEDGVMTDIPSTIGGNASAAWDINNHGRIVGSASTGSERHAFLWVDGAMTDLGTLGGESSTAHGVNDVGQVVGWSERAPGGDRIFHAFLWEDGKMIDVGALLGLSNGKAEVINNQGQILIGKYLYDSSTGAVADLHDRISADSGWSELSARDLNDAGQIVGVGTIDGLRHAFLMTPVPIPTLSAWGMVVLTVLVVTAGTIVIARRRERGRGCSE
jgi:probable HAF family extracellular repeat protein